MTSQEYNNTYRVLRKLGRAFVPLKDLFSAFQDGLQKLGFESVADSTRQRGVVSVKIDTDIIGNEGDIKAFICRYGKEISRFTIFPTAEDFIRLGIEIGKAESFK